jgi:hypothetical protein
MDWPLHPIATATVVNNKAQANRAAGIKSFSLMFLP